MIATPGTVGGVAQLGERTVRIRKVESSILFVSTKKPHTAFAVCGFFAVDFVDRTLEKAVAFSQVLRRETRTIAILAQNRSSDPLRLHQNKKGHPCGDPFCFYAEMYGPNSGKSGSFFTGLRRETWTIAILAQNRSSDPLWHCFILTNLRHIDIINGVVNLFAGLAQLVEQLICNQQVGGSSPSTSSKRKSVLVRGRIFVCICVRKDTTTFCNAVANII